MPRCIAQFSFMSYSASSLPRLADLNCSDAPNVPFVPRNCEYNPACEISSKFRFCIYCLGRKPISPNPNNVASLSKFAVCIS